MKTLLIDDMRDLHADVIARNYHAGKLLLETFVWDTLFLDHDLGNAYGDTGYDLLCWIEETKEKRPEVMPDWVQLVTSNPAGRERMERALKAMGYTKHGHRWQSPNAVPEEESNEPA